MIGRQSAAQVGSAHNRMWKRIAFFMCIKKPLDSGAEPGRVAREE
jgi:hypothetical protein